MAMTIAQLESSCMEMIALAGEGRAKVFEALDALLAGDRAKSLQILEEAEELLGQAHQIQFLQLMKPQAEGETIPFHLLLIHAMDLLMTSASEKDLVQKAANRASS